MPNLMEKSLLLQIEMYLDCHHTTQPKLSNYGETMPTPWERYKEKNGVTPLDLLNPKTKKTTEEVFDTRLTICMECPELIPAINQCTKCGCLMELKAKLEAAKCPIGKW